MKPLLTDDQWINGQGLVVTDGRYIVIKPSAMVILRQLGAGPSCPHDFMTECRTARYGARIMELRNAGLSITKGTCDKPNHAHRQHATLYTLEKPDGETVVFTTRATWGEFVWEVTRHG